MSDIKVKEHVLKIYPDAKIVNDSHNYGKNNGALYSYILVSGLPKTDGVIHMDMLHVIQDKKVIPRSGFCRCEEDCWNSAWNSILEITENAFND
jgi:hypothetical protein